MEKTEQILEIIRIVFIFLTGISVGSFLNVCIYRIPLGKSIVFPRSHCPKCNNQLKWFDLFPIFSWMFLKGKCRFCGTKISFRYTFVELITGLLYIALYFKLGLSVEFLFNIFFVSVLIIILFIDYDKMIIPDKLVLTLMIGGVFVFIYNILYGYKLYEPVNWYNPLIGMFSASGILLLISIIGLIIYKNDGAMGMGDVKLMIPAGIFLGWKLVIIALIGGVFAGGVIGALLMILKKKEGKSKIPFGPFLIFGILLAIFWGYDIINWYLFTYWIT